MDAEISAMKTNTQEKLIYTLCHTHTDLKDNEIFHIARMAKDLNNLATQNHADVFINCLCVNKTESIVIAHSTDENSLYEFSSVGHIANELDEPAVFRSFRLQIETDDVLATTSAKTVNNQVVQNVRLIRFEDRVIGVLIFEKALGHQIREAQPFAADGAPGNIERIKLKPYLNNLDWVGACVPVGMIVVDANGYVCFRNAETLRIYTQFGYLHDIIGMEYRKISLHGEIDENSLNNGPVSEKEFSIRNEYYLAKQYCMQKEEQFYVIIIQHISQEKHSEAMLRLKTAVIRETDHRIKNSLQMIHSLLDMQKSRMVSPQAVEALQDAMNRIMSIRVMHELLAQNNNNIPFNEIITKIITHYDELTKRSGKKITFQTTGGDVTINSDHASFIGMVINEIIQNAYKHAFKGRRKGHIYINVACDALYTTISIRDDGIGYDTAQAKTDGLGLQLIKMIINEKLNGQLRIETCSTGTNVEFDVRMYR
jgi:two-component sensor histidine kinase